MLPVLRYRRSKDNLQVGFRRSPPLNEGVELDTKTQLVTVAINTDSQADFDSLSKAIDKAGYDPAKAYFLEDAKFTTRSIALSSKN